jgi:serine/threonine protein kinase
VEILLDEEGLLPTVACCPFCGGAIESRLSELGTQSGEPPESLLASALDPPRKARPWSEVWAKGSHGTLGRFQLRELLGDGASGQVYQAYDPRLDRDVALKVLRQADPGERVMERFFREARAAARLEHPNIVAVYDAGCDENRCWIAYQFVRGRTLLGQRDHQRLELVTAVRIIRDLADALDHAHQQGIYHRDLKPSNILIDDQGRPHLTDFGLARRADVNSDLTRDGAILGTPVYMSPEQASGRSHLADQRSDVYSLGVIFYELLSGRRPTNLPSQAPFWMTNPVKPPPAPRTYDRAIPRSLERICLKAMALEPDQRHPDARALRDEIDLWLRKEFEARRFLGPLGWIAAGTAAVLLLGSSTRSGLAWPTRPALAPSMARALPEPQPDQDQPVPLILPPRPGTPASRPDGALAEVDAARPLVGNKGRSKTYHTPTCGTLATMKVENRIDFRNVEDALRMGYHPCGTCNPPKGNPAPAAGEEDAAPD